MDKVKRSERGYRSRVYTDRPDMAKQDIEILKILMNKAKERELGVNSNIYYYALKHAIEELERIEDGRLGRNPGDQCTGTDLPVRDTDHPGDPGGQREKRRIAE